MRNRGIGRARLFVGGFLLLAAVINWLTAVMLSPHGPSSAEGLEHVRNTVVIFMRNSAIGTLVLCAIAVWLLFPLRRPKKPWRDWAIAGTLAIMAATSIYQLIWLQTSVAG